MQTVVIQEERQDGAQPAAVVTANGITRRYGEGQTCVDALRGVSLDVASGKLTAVMGPSGSGKSTLMHILAGLDRPTSGEVEIDGTNITELSDTELTKLRRRHIGFIFQFFNLLPMLTAEENVVLPLELAGTKPDRAWVKELTGKLPDELTTVVNLATAPPSRGGQREARGRRQRMSFRIAGGGRAGLPTAEGVRRSDRRPDRTMPYTEMQRLVDGQWGPGFHNYFKSSWLPRLDDEAIETLLDAHEQAASPDTKIQLYHFGGAVGRVPPGETAFAHRSAPFLLNIAAGAIPSSPTSTSAGPAGSTRRYDRSRPAAST